MRVRRSTAGKKMFCEENSKTTKKQGKWAPFPLRMQNKAAYRTAALFRGRVILFRFAVDHIAQHREQH
ncbi:hypothetical protein SEEH0828_06180 [Salmonella enterica subsp. enterica serovar Heidelberg str. 579082-8]|nr:hypothetical protein CFSAN002064_20710 [Salmonella enterica subsp. enterica serovar Heidelberg str. CFSAN002064]EYI38227.1 hypothetical protein SEEH1576_10482 [Salmonella enterica subsp. enterica serovar Heidelberg str. 41576]KJT41600.1 hypothetical protein SEEH0828_06180 [Salmonella enterica subsp. enterica serovar Heidelberg str. 579082-8]KMU16214.1 hypothetical protein SEEN1469_01080 [Salmonella enterica subsp. enterica serovar Newport str. MA_10EN1469]